MDAISLHLDIQNSLNQTMKEVYKTTTNFNSKLEDSASNFENISKTTDTIQDNYDEITESTEKIVKDTTNWGQKLSGVGNAIKNMIPGFGLIFGGGLIADVVGQTFELDTMMTKISFRMGEAGESTQFLKDTVIDVAHQTGIATDQAAEFVAGLKQLRVANEDLRQLTTDAARFAEITGATNQTVITLTGELSRTGRLGQESISGILASIVNVQRAFGLTEAEVEGLSETIQYSTKMLNQMGKSASFIEGFAKGATKLAAAFVQVGLSAQDANKFIEDLLDPGRLEDNALLYSRLGISMEDAISGNVDPGVLASKFKTLGAELKSMSGPAAQAMAESLGMPLNQLRQMSEMDISALEETFGGAGDASEELAAQQEEQLATQEKFEKTMNRIKTVFVDLADAFMPIIDQFASFIHSGGKDLTGMIHGWVDKLKEFIPKIASVIKSVGNFIGKIFKPAMIIGGIVALFMLMKKFKSKWKSMSESNAKATQDSFSGIKESLADAMVEATNMASEKGATILAKELPRKLRGKTIDLETRIKTGPAYAETMKIADNFDRMAEGNLFPFAKKWAKDTADTQRSLAMGAKPLRKINLLTQENYRVIGDKLQLMKEEEAFTLGAIKERREASVEENRILDERMAYLTQAEEMGIKIKNAEWEKEQIINRQTNLQKELGKLDIEEEAQTTRFNELQKTYVSNLSQQQLTAIYQELQARKEAEETATIGLEKEREAIEIRNTLIEEEMAFLKKKGGLNPLLEAQYREELNKNEIAIIETNDAIKRSQELTKGLAGEMADVEDAASKAGKEIIKSSAQNPAFVKKTKGLWDYVKSVGSDLKTKLKGGWDKAKNSAKTIWEGFKENIKPSNWVKSLRKLGDGSLLKGIGKGFGKVMGGVAKIGGPLLLMGGALSQMAPVQEALAKVMEDMKPAIDALKDSFMKMLSGLMDQLIPVFTSLAENILPAIMKIMKAVVPMFIMLVKMLLPPLLDALAFLIDILGNVIVAIGSLIGIFDKTLGDNLKDFGEGLKDSASAMRDAAGEMRKSNASAETTRRLDETRALLLAQSNQLMGDGLQGEFLTMEQTEQLKTTLQDRIDQVKEQIEKEEKTALEEELKEISNAIMNFSGSTEDRERQFNEMMMISHQDLAGLGLELKDFTPLGSNNDWFGNFSPEVMIDNNEDLGKILGDRITASTDEQSQNFKDLYGVSFSEIESMNADQMQMLLDRMAEQEENDNANTDQLTDALGENGEGITQEMEPAMLRATADGGWEVEQKARVVNVETTTPQVTAEETTADATQEVSNNTAKLLEAEDIANAERQETKELLKVIAAKAVWGH